MQILKKQSTLSVIIGISMALMFVIHFVVLSLNLAQPFNVDNFFSLFNLISLGSTLVIYAFMMVLLFYLSAIPLLLSLISLIRKKVWGIRLSLYYFSAITISLIVFQVINGILTTPALILLIINLVIAILSFVLVIIRDTILKSGTIKTDNTEIKPVTKKVLYGVLVLNIVSLLIYTSTFFIPIYSLVDQAPIYHAMISGALIYNDTNIEIIAMFLVNFTVVLIMLFALSNIISRYFFDKKTFIKDSMQFIHTIFGLALVFFIGGLIFNIFYTLEGRVSQTYAFIPISGMVVVIFIFAVLKGKYHMDNPLEEKQKKIKYVKAEPLYFVILLTAISVSLLLLPIIVMTVTFGNFDYTVSLTGLKILSDYANLDPGYRLVAYVLVVMLLSVGLMLVLSIAGYLSNFKQFSALVRFTSIVNLFFVFVISVSGYYFQIAQAINETVLMDMFAFYGITIPSNIEYESTIGTNTIYVLLAMVTVLVIMFFRNAFNKDYIEAIAAEVIPSETEDLEKETEQVKSNQIESDVSLADPCPAFTELDLKTELFQLDLETRLKHKTDHQTLNELVHFVVDYARNSRLHLSYSTEDIATFISGLGAAKLSILQGMSGTGKTSLPKIFAEAVFGNCEIIEVESSWKDKNELLGYYNEFSMKYTPKKFTLALYKAALNQDIFTFILLDEMNLSRIEYYFSDFLSLMENEENNRQIKLLNIGLNRLEDDQVVSYKALKEGHTLLVPKNVWFIGTANRDESTFVISDKVYDRAHTMNFTKRAPKVRNYKEPMEKSFYDYQTIQSLFDEALKNGKFDAESNPTIKAVEGLLTPFNISFGNRILKQIEDFVNIYTACFPDEDVEAIAIEKILLSKVVAKLETKTIDDKEKLEQAFLKLNLNACASFVSHLDND